jgi:hypothetical protein
MRHQEFAPILALLALEQQRAEQEGAHAMIEQ